MDDVSVYKPDAVRCPYCGGLMQCCSYYRNEGLYTEKVRYVAYTCTECGSSAPPVRTDMLFWQSVGDDFPDQCRARALAEKRFTEV